MDKEQCKRKPRTNTHNKTIVCSIRITANQSAWLTKNQYSPARILYQAMKELGYKEPTLN